MAKSKKARGLVLRESGDQDGFSTLDVVNGLHGVCAAADSVIQSASDLNMMQELAMAAKILSAILAERVEI